MESPLNSIVRQGEGERYIRLENTVGQSWYFPYRNTQAYMSLYQPSSLKGTIIAFILPYIKRLKWMLRFVNASIVRLQFDVRFIKTVEKAFDRYGISVAVFSGSPGKHQKPTLLLLSDNCFVGYCKISDNTDVIELFKEEKRTLDYLSSVGVANIPSAVYCAPWSEGESSWILLQTTERERNVNVALPEDESVTCFVRHMSECTKVKLDYEDTEFACAMDNLRRLTPLLQEPIKEDFILKNIDSVETELKRQSCYYAAYHGDLTPWNSFVVKGHLFAFDFEYFKRTYPLYADYFHFFTQSLIYDNYANANQIMAEYQKLKNSVLSWVENPDFLYKCYILAIMEFYLNRDKGLLNKRIVDIFNIWFELLIKICNGSGIKPDCI